MEVSSSENIIRETYKDNYTPSEIEEELYNKVFCNIFHIENIEEGSHGWQRVRQAIEPKIERQRAFSDQDREVDLTDNIFRSIDLSAFNMNQSNSKTEKDVSGNNIE